MPASESGGPALYRQRAVFRNPTQFLDNPGLIAGAYLEAIPVLNGAIKADSGVGLPETELDLEARAQSWILGQESRETWP